MTVHWTTSAREQLGNVWLKGDSERRRAITAAADAVDKRLATDPFNEGESRPDNQRITFEPPLGLTFRVERSAVYVLRVWDFQ